MMKKFTIIVLLMVLLKATLFGQSSTVSLSPVTTNSGQTFSVPLTVTNFNNISVHSSLVVTGNNVLNSLEYLITGVSS